MPNNHRSLVLTVLSRYVGRENGISMREFERQLDLLPRHIRQHISDLREDGVAVCGTPKTGYFIAQTAEELEETCQFIRSRSMHGLRMEAQMRKIPMLDLIGQLKLST